MTRVPTACELSDDDADTRVEEWRQFLATEVVDVERSGRAVRLRLRDGGEGVLAGVDLAWREKACCSFFEFRLVPLPEAVWLEVEAPEEAAAVLDGLVDLRRS